MPSASRAIANIFYVSLLYQIILIDNDVDPVLKECINGG